MAPHSRSKPIAEMPKFSSIPANPNANNPNPNPNAGASTNVSATSINAAATPAPGGPQPRAIDVENFIRVRDSFYARLSTIQDLLRTFALDYLRQTNLLLGEGTGLENVPELSSMEHMLSGLAPMPMSMINGLAATGGYPATGLAVADEKRRKKRQHDPNHPKRPLTPFFLYMQTARPIIASDLGPDAPKGAVQDEGQRRWAAMNPSEKQGWNTAYQYNLRLYNARVHSYKHGNVNAKSMSDEEALKYADDFGIDLQTHIPLDVTANGTSIDPAILSGAPDLLAATVVAIANPASDDESDSVAGEAAAAQDPIVAGNAQGDGPHLESEPEPEPEPKPTAKTPKKLRRCKSGSPTADHSITRSTSAAAAAVAAAPQASPEPAKKRKRASKVAAAEPDEQPKEPKKSSRKKSKSS